MVDGKQNQNLSETPAERLKAIVPHLKIAASMAQIENPDGTNQLAIVSTSPDGSGHIAARFDMDGFIDDLVAVVGDPVLEECKNSNQEADNERG